MSRCCSPRGAGRDEGGRPGREMARGASDRGEGAALTYDGLRAGGAVQRPGQLRRREAAGGASGVDEIVISPWALYELVEAAARSDQRERARAAADQLSQLSVASASNWALGAAARSRALRIRGRAAEEEYREAIELLGRTRMATHLARARLVYGEWLRGRSGGSMPATSCGPRSTRSRRWAPRPSPNARGGAPGDRRDGAQAQRGYRVDLTPRGGDRPAGLRGTYQLRDRRAAVHRPPHRGVAPRQGVRQAGHRLPHRARPGPEEEEPPVMTEQMPGGDLRAERGTNRLDPPV